MTTIIKPSIAEGKAIHAIKFMEALPHTQGIWAGKTLPLLEWERGIIRDIFGTLKSDGTRQYRIAYIEIPKKNGKTAFAARIALYLAYADNEMGAEVYFAATDRDQAGICYRAARDSIKQTRLNQLSIIVDSVKRIVYPRTGSFLQVLSADVKKHYGLNVHGAVIDELHAHPNRDLYDVLTKGSGEARRQPLYVIITTAGFDRNSICYELHNKARQIEKGLLEDPTFYGKVYGLEDDEDWEDEENWKRVNPSLGTIFTIDRLREAYKSAKGNPVEENLFRRLRLNQWTASESRWIDVKVWDECQSMINWDSLKGQSCCAGLDLSSTTDITALVLAFKDGDHHILRFFFWLPQDTAEKRLDKVDYLLWANLGYIELTPGNVIDYDYIMERLNQLSIEYNIQDIGYDPWNATQLVVKLQEQGFTMTPIRQGFFSLSAPTKDFEALVLSKKIRYDGNPVMRWMVDNVSIKMDPAGNIKPDKASSRDRIDGILASIMSIDRANRYETEDAGMFVV